MIGSIIYKLKNNKLLMALVIVLLVVAVFDLAVIIFDIVELVLAAGNPAKLAAGFLAFNIAAAIINLAAAILVVLYITLRRK